jgi:DNA helicase-2/ATP-dependent DNA helicase PcrA
MNTFEYLPTYLTTDQRDAILYTGSPLLIIAGPGSGKTEVITWRVVHFVLTGLIKPENLLVTTFTNKAALELKDRIQQRLPEVDVESMQVSTLHSLCTDLLRQYQSLSSMPFGFHILDEHDQLLFVYTERKTLGLDSLVKGRPFDSFSNVLRLFSLATEELVEPDKLGEWCECRRAEAEVYADELTGGRSKNKAEKAVYEVSRWCEEKIVIDAYRHYVALLRERCLTDFAFLQRYAYDLLNAHPEIVDEQRDRYHSILVDEYQDTNSIQEKILKLLAGDGDNLTVVGDDDQSIYRFRGATVRNILTFSQRYSKAHLVRLTENFRSLEPIVDNSLQVITHNPARFEKALFTNRGSGSDVLLIYKHSIAEEAAALVGLLYRLYKTGKMHRWKDVVILLRSVRSYAEPYADALRVAGIPVVVTGDATLFQHEYIEQLANTFTFLGATKPWGDVYIRQPIMELEESTIIALQAFSGSLLELNKIKLQEIGVTSSTDCHKLSSLLELKRRVQNKEHSCLLAVFYDLLTITGYFSRCEQTGDLEAILNLGVFSRLVAAFDEYGGTRNLYRFLDYLKLIKEGGVDPAVVEPEDAVRIMTIHQAKGLEFPVVVVASLMNGRLPSTRRREHYEVPHKLRASGPPEVEDPHMVDERKLFYVATTRARELLILGTADVVNKRGGGPSPFLVEMLGQDLLAAADLSQACVNEIESRTESIVGPRERLSFSQLVYFLQCPVRYKFAVVYGMELPRPDPIDFGANVHRALLNIHDQARQGHITRPANIEGIIALTWMPAIQADPSQDRQAKKAAVRQLQQYVTHYADSLKRIFQAEAGFSFELKQHVLVGKIDLLRKSEGGFELVDFKAGRSSSAALEQVAAQLDLYALGAGSSLKLPITKLCAHFLEDDQVYTRDWSLSREELARNGFEYIIDRITRHNFTPRFNYCAHCAEFRTICPYVEG